MAKTRVRASVQVAIMMVATVTVVWGYGWLFLPGFCQPNPLLIPLIVIQTVWGAISGVIHDRRGWWAIDTKSHLLNTVGGAILMGTIFCLPSILAAWLSFLEEGKWFPASKERGAIPR